MGDTGGIGGTTNAMTGGRSWARSLSPLMIAAGFALGMTAPLELLYARRFSTGSLAVGLFLMSSVASIILVDLLGTRFVPRLEARATLTAGILLFGAASVLFGVTTTFWPLIVARILQGLGATVLTGAALQAAVRVHDSHEHALGSVQGAQMLGQGVGAPCGGLAATLVAGTAGYRLAFGLCALACLLIALAFRLGLPTLPSPAKAEIGLPDFAGGAGMRRALALGVLGNYLRSGVQSTGLPLIGDARGYSTATIGLAVGLLSIVMIGTLRSSRRIFTRVEPGRCLVAASGGGISAAAVLALVDSPAAFFGAGLVFGGVIAVAMVAPPLLILSRSRDTAEGLAPYRIASSVGSVLGSTSVNAAVTAVGTAGALSAIGGVLLGGIGLGGSIARRPAAGDGP
jgi:MFS family permease